MRNFPDESKLPSGFAADVAERAINGSILRVELEHMSRQSCRKWFPFMRALAATRSLWAIRERYAVGSYTGLSWCPNKGLGCVTGQTAVPDDTVPLRCLSGSANCAQAHTRERSSTCISR